MLGKNCTNNICQEALRQELSSKSIELLFDDVDCVNDVWYLGCQVDLIRLMRLSAASIGRILGIWAVQNPDVRF